MCEELHDPFEDQVECARYKAERDALAQRMEEVAAEIDRTLSGVEGIEDAPAMRWMSGLREALGALHSPRTSYDDIEAARWVREHGGLDSVKNLLDWVVGHCSTKQQLDFDFWLSGRVMYELGFEEDMADRDEVERRLLARLMPDGMADMSVRDLISLLEEVDSAGGEGLYRLRADQLTHERPVLDADGAEIYEGRIAYGTRGRKYRVTALCEYEPSIVHAQALDDGELGDEFIAANTGLNSYQLDASKLTHERPDSWERLERDADVSTCTYFGATTKDCEICGHVSWECSYDKARDLVRRCRALAERERGE